MARAGRKSKYESHVKPHLEKIKNYKKMGATDEQICNALDISKTSFYEYINKYPEFSETLKKGKDDFVLTLKGRLALLTEPHKLETKKQYIKVDEVTGNKTQYTEITTRDVDPDVAAINLLLKNLDRDNWANDPQSISLKQQELELRKSIAKSQNFDLELDEDKNNNKNK